MVGLYHPIHSLVSVKVYLKVLLQLSAVTKSQSLPCKMNDQTNSVIKRPNSNEQLHNQKP